MKERHFKNETTSNYLLEEKNTSIRQDHSEDAGGSQQAEASFRSTMKSHQLKSNHSRVPLAL